MDLSRSLKTQNLPGALTSYDVLKTLALVLMVVDHIGYFFFPEEMWFRVIGRLSVPIWFFLIGFARTREIPKLFWVMALVVTASALIAGEYLFPLNILFTLILARLSIDWIYTHALRNREAFLGMFFLLFLGALPSLIFIEYGTLGLLFTLMGALRRRKDEVSAPGWMIWSFFAAGALAYIIIQGALLPSISGAQLAVLVLGMAALSITLYFFQPQCYERLNVKTVPLVGMIMFTGRRTLEIYAVHVVVLRFIAMFTQPERFTFGEFQLFAFSRLISLLL